MDGLKNAKIDFFGVIRGEQNVSIESMVCGFYPKEDLDKSEEILLSNNLNELEIIDSDEAVYYCSYTKEELNDFLNS